MKVAGTARVAKSVNRPLTSSDQPVTGGRLLSTREAMAYLSCSRRTFWRLVAARAFPGDCRGRGRGQPNLYREDELERFLPAWQQRPRNEGWRTDKDGYIEAYVGRGDPMANGKGYVYLHRLVMADMVGRDLLPTEVVHHINSVKDDNDPSNLQLCANAAEHMALHRKGT